MKIFCCCCLRRYTIFPLNFGSTSCGKTFYRKDISLSSLQMFNLNTFTSFLPSSFPSPPFPEKKSSNFLSRNFLLLLPFSSLFFFFLTTTKNYDDIGKIFFLGSLDDSLTLFLLFLSVYDHHNRIEGGGGQFRRREQKSKKMTPFS